MEPTPDPQTSARTVDAEDAGGALASPLQDALRRLQRGPGPLAGLISDQTIAAVGGLAVEPGPEGPAR